MSVVQVSDPRCMTLQRTVRVGFPSENMTSHLPRTTRVREMGSQKRWETEGPLCSETPSLPLVPEVGLRPPSPKRDAQGPTRDLEVKRDRLIEVGFGTESTDLCGKYRRETSW